MAFKTLLNSIKLNRYGRRDYSINPLPIYTVVNHKQPEGDGNLPDRGKNCLLSIVAGVTLELILPSVV
jgi:hypothetical protein